MRDGIKFESDKNMEMVGLEPGPKTFNDNFSNFLAKFFLSNFQTHIIIDQIFD
jgi:hypothetical protein